MVLELQNKTSFTCQQLPLTDRNGANILRIVLKASYEISPDEQLLQAENQADIIMEDQYWGKPGDSSVRYESDITLDKPYTDIIINGHAYAPQGRGVREMDVYVHYQKRLLKRLRIFGDRKWNKGLFGWHKTTPEPFRKMPIVYDRAYGGSDEKGSEPRNRSGTGYSSSLDNKFKGTSLPNVEFPDQLIKSPRNKPTPAGLGVISKHWEPRLSFAGTYDNRWIEDRFPLLPLDFDMRFNQSVPRDQWVNRPQGSEIVEIMGMTKEGNLKFQLPECLLINIILHYKTHTEKKSMDIDTVFIEPDEHRVTLTWRSSADIHGDPFRLLAIVVGSNIDKKLANNCNC